MRPGCSQLDGRFRGYLFDEFLKYELYRHGKISVDLWRESWLDTGCRHMRVSGKELVQTLKNQGAWKEGRLDFKRVRECKCGWVDRCRSHGIQIRNVVYKEIGVLGREL
jgi:hypothetical protein